MMFRTLAGMMLTIVLLFGMTPGAVAADLSYPSKPVHLILPFPPGGTTDTIARALAERLTKSLKQTVLVENRGGAGGMIGAKLVASAAPDGYTLLFGATSLAVGVTTDSKDTYDVIEDLVGVSMVAEVTLVLAANPSLAARNTKELVALAKAQPGKLNTAIPGIWSVPHLFALLFMQQTEAKFAAVPYNGGGPAVTDLLGGHADLTFINLPTVLEYIKAGKLKAVGVAGNARSELLPDVPTFQESGYAGLVATTWNAVLAPKGTPKEIIAILNKEITAAMGAAEMKRYLSTLGAMPGSATDADAFIRNEARRWRKVVKDAGAKLN